MTTPGLPLPEISENGEAEFERSWIKFKLVAAANKWDDAKALLMLPALLRGKLVEIYVSLPDEKKVDLDTLKRALKESAGLTRDQLSLSKAFSERKQGVQEKVADFERGLKKTISRSLSRREDNHLNRSITTLFGWSATTNHQADSVAGFTRGHSGGY